MSDCSCGHSVHDHEADEGCTRCNCGAYKPAATVQRHGTGSGEAKWERQEACSECDGDGCLACTPPASPTVTLDRIDHAFESAISALAWLPQDGPIRKRTAEVVDELRAARQLLVLLRAAERQK